MGSPLAQTLLLALGAAVSPVLLPPTLAIQLGLTGFGAHVVVRATSGLP